MPTSPPQSPSTSAISALNALDLALQSQKLELDALESVRRWLPLLEQIEKVCRGFAELDPVTMRDRAGSVALIAEVAARAATESGLERISDVGARVDPARHVVVAATAAAGVERGTILSVEAVGWMFQGRVLAPARVIAVGG
jgi:molecular chaperone GrpE